MKPLKISLFCTTLVLLFMVSVACNQETGSRSQSAAQKAPTQERPATVELWICPMHPQIHQDHPGQCPICGMNLEKSQTPNPTTAANSTTTNEIKDHALFELTFDKVQMIGVKLGKVVRQDVIRSIEATGKVAFDPELYSAQSEYIEALAQAQRVAESPIGEIRHSANKMVESAKLRLKMLGLSDQQIGQLRQRPTHWLFPQQGESLTIYANIFEMDLPWIKPGQEALISSGSQSTAAQGKVVSIDRIIDQTTRTAKVRIELNQAIANLRPESYVDVQIHVPLGKLLTIPLDAILDTGKYTLAFVVRPSADNYQFEPRMVTIQQYVGDHVVISDGLLEDETIVTSANFLIDSESRLQAVIQKAKR